MDPRGAQAVEFAAASELRRLLGSLRRHYDSRSWWPARTRFEMMAGALLTQRTRWETAAAAARRLRQARLLSPEKLCRAIPAAIAARIRPCGNHGAKAARLLALAGFIREHGGLRALARLPTTTLRRALLQVPGIGPETADAILLYAFHRAVFVADAYALRWLARTGWLRRAGLAARYEPVHRRVTAIFDDRDELAALHAVIVEHGKCLCRAKPQCASCFLAAHCDTGGGLTGSRKSRR